MANTTRALIADAPEFSNGATEADAPRNKHTHTIIFLHGREDFGSDLAQYFFDSKASDGRSLAEIFPSVRWVFPTAKMRYSAQRDFEFSNSSFAEALKGEEIISQWFDVWDIKTPAEKEELMIPGLQESIEDILDIVRAESQTVPLDRIILGGISQGCATAILTLLSSDLQLGGFIGFCSWLPFKEKIEQLPTKSINREREISRYIKTMLEISSATRNFEELETSLVSLSVSPTTVIRPSVFLAHSRDDETVPFTMGEALKLEITRLGFDVTWKEYTNGGHWIHAEHGIDDLSTFLHRVMSI
ncbi:alpha/beta-hydrolase [Acephala macrosclerotiorum]|nr:alpha/beta-hydrolase [Acephala macrosclerotiorum]